MPASKTRLKNLFLSSEVVFPSTTRILPNVMVYTNAAEIGLTSFAETILQKTYAPREMAYEAVQIGRLPPGALVYAGHEWVQVQETFVANQVSPLDSFEDTLRCFDLLSSAVTDVDEPCLLLARYGEQVWGHWLCEILPAAIIAERLFPGRFRFAVSALVTEPSEGRSFSTAVLESLAAYGIHPDRLFRMEPGTRYRFRELYAVSGLWTDAFINPDVLRIVREDVRCEAAGYENIAVLRQSAGSTRTIFNRADISDLLAANTFHEFDPVSLPFAAQAGLFAGATRIFSVLGSGLAGLLYARDEVQVVAVAPGAWPDTYFRCFLQLANAHYADVRGPPLWTGQGLERDAAILVNPDHLACAFQAVQLPRSQTFSVGNVTVPHGLEPVCLEIDFSATGNSAAYRWIGWSHQEPNHVYNDGPVSVLAIPADGLPDMDLLLDLSLIALVAPPYLIGRRLEIEAGDRALGVFRVEGFDRVLCRIPKSCVKAGVLALVFRHAFCVPAHSLGYGSDDRATNVGFMNLKLRRTND